MTLTSSQRTRWLSTGPGCASRRRRVALGRPLRGPDVRGIDLGVLPEPL
ncbi:Hypothetical protein CAP_1572 [Chondromyces apiculatus DSM 436]|uniref:Uncharacterized protein n=1 Tax=Chondromyces apiculatus DSM 436 TaxID=1192034 RepID=A0A017TDI4_9BACT|nr:Hypothetical protein CAP_1572 [Chondromyces apiculatus DSM 436]